jgi:hypothetical protein
VLCQSQRSRGLRRRSAAARLLRSWVRIPPGVWMYVCCVLSGRGLCDELITHPEESYRPLCIIVCDIETSRMRRPWPALGRRATAKKKEKNMYYVINLLVFNKLKIIQNTYIFYEAKPCGKNLTFMWPCLGLGLVTGTFVMFRTYTFAPDRLKERLLLQEDCIHTLMCLLHCKVALNWVKFNSWY